MSFTRGNGETEAHGVSLLIHLLGRRARESYLISLGTLRPGVTKHADGTKLLLRMLSDSRIESRLTHLKIFVRSSPQQTPGNLLVH